MSRKTRLKKGVKNIQTAGYNGARMLIKICSFYEDRCAIFISFKSVVIFADFVLISAEMTTLLKEMRIAQLSS